MKTLFFLSLIILLVACSEDNKPIEESFRVVTYANAIGDTVYRVQEWYSQRLHPAVLNFANNSHYQWWDKRLAYWENFMEYATKQEAHNKIHSIIKERIAKRNKIFHRIENK